MGESTDLGSEFPQQTPPSFRADLPELRFNSAGFGWKSFKDESNTPATFTGSDVRGAQWIR
jgi:hypothetical protein